MFKKSSILDPIQPSLPKDVWTKDLKLKPHIRKQILDELFSFILPEQAKEVYIIGTVAGHQYTDTSDIDINVAVWPPELAEDLVLKKKRKAVGGNLAKGTKREINFFLVPYRGVPSNWQDSSAFGVYDVLNNQWNVPPEDIKTLRDPQQEFFLELKTAHMVLNNFKNLLEKYKSNIKLLNFLKELPDEDLEKPYKIKLIESEISKTFNEMLYIAHELDRQRKEEYRLGFGVPRKNYENIVFKLFHHDPELKDQFEFLKELKHPDFKDRMREIMNQINKDAGTR